jgi:hypothetical protein
LVVQADATQMMVVVEPLVLLAGASVDVGGRPTTVGGGADANIDAAGLWGEKDTPPGISKDSYQMGLP